MALVTSSSNGAASQLCIGAISSSFMCVALQWRDHKRKISRSFTTDAASNNGPLLRCAFPKLAGHFAYGRTRLNCDVSHQAPGSRRSGHVDNEDVIQRASGKFASERKIQRPLHLSA